jgi:hypothetical protein
MLPWPVFMKFELMLDLRNTLVHIFSDSQAALKALQAAKTTSPLLRQCQRALNDISTYHAVGLLWVPGHSGIRGNEIADELARGGSIYHFVGPELALGVSRQSIKKKIQCWLYKQHMPLWQGLAGTQRQAREMISGPRKAAKTRQMQSRVVIGLLNGRDTLRKHLHIVGLSDSPFCRKCGSEEETADV